MIDKLERLIGEIGDLNSKLVLLVGASRSGKTKLLRELGTKLNIEPLNVGMELGRRLAATPNNTRGLSAGELLRELADKERTDDPLLLDNLELLFEPGLRINPLELVKRLAHSKCVIRRMSVRDTGIIRYAKLAQSRALPRSAMKARPGR